MAAGAEPDRVKAMIDAARPRLLGAALCGAGGGGFLALITREPDDVAGLRGALGDLADGASFHVGAVDPDGIIVERGVK